MVKQWKDYTGIMKLSPSNLINLNQPPERKTVLAGLKVLMVESDRDTQVLHQYFLERHGVTVFTASSVAQALSLVPIHSPHVVMSSLRLNGEDSYSLMRQIQNLGIGQSKVSQTKLGNFNHWTMPVGLAIDSGHPWCCCPIQSTGYQWYLAKPFCLDELIEILGFITEEFVPSPLISDRNADLPSHLH
jgi:CheY-like chemotaxis protein